jgi:outer membrane protein TolC
VLPSDALRAVVALDEVRLAQEALRAQRKALGRELAAGIGRDGQIEPGPLAYTPRPSERPDLQAAEQAVRAQRTARSATGLAMLPRVVADAGWQTTDNQTLVKQSWADVGVKVQWSLGAGRATDLHAAGLTGLAAQHRLEHTRRTVTNEVAAATDQLALAHRAVDVRQQSVLRVEQAAQVLVDRYRQALAPLTDVLAVQADLAAQRAGLASARLDVQRAELAAAFVGASAD